MSADYANMHFLRLGVQNYIAARSAALAGLSTVCGNLYHHAIEMLLKARLSQEHTLEELRSPAFGHKLLSLWKAFKCSVSVSDLDHFDNTIETLNAFERIRYPDNIIKEGASISISLDRPSAPSIYGAGIQPPPRYEVVITDIDRLVARIFEVSSRNPFFFTGSMNPYAREAITRDNPVSGVWFSTE